MAFAVPSDPVLLLALVSAVTVGALSASLILYMLVLRVVQTRQQRRWQRCIATWRPLIAQCMESMPSDVPRLRRGEEFALLTLWNHTQECVRGDTTKRRLNILAQQAGLHHVGRRLLAKRGLYGRLLAVVTLGHLRDAPSWMALETLTADPRPALSLSAVRALMRIDVQHALPELLPALLNRREWPLSRVANMLAEAGPAQVSEPLLNALPGASDPELARLVRLLEFARGETLTTVMDRLLRHSNDEDVLLACLKSRHLPPHDAPAIRKLVRHPSWEVRTLAASALGRIGTRNDIPALTQALQDPVWWVRYRAARALVALPGVAGHELVDIRDGLDDAYATNMLDQAMAEAGS